MEKTVTKNWKDIADEYGISVGLLKASLYLDKLKLKSPTQRKLFPNQIKEIYRQLGTPEKIEKNNNSEDTL